MVFALLLHIKEHCCDLFNFNIADCVWRNFTNRVEC